jgi:lipid-A-disaccharide synthase
MKIFISAAEASSDAHGAELLKAIRSQLPDSNELDAYGMGGPKLQAAGLRSIVDAREFLAMGFIEVISRLPRVFSAIRQMTEAAQECRPDIAIVIDYPDFHFRLARKFKKLGIPMIYYIPPKVWAWRKRRVEFLRRFFFRILCILPFEEDFYKKLDISVKYVGNPLIDELPLEMTQAEARRELALQNSDRVIVLMPGSRPSEFKQHLELMLDSALLAQDQMQRSGFLKREEYFKVLIPFPATAEMGPLQDRIKIWKEQRNCRLDLRLSQNDADVCLVAADAGLIKSGTSTLEAGLLRCPHAVVYKPGRTATWIFKNLIRYRGPVALVNLVAGWEPGQKYLASEILCEQVTQEALAEELVSLLTTPEKRRTMIEGFNSLREKVFGGHLRSKSPSQVAAQEIIRAVQELQKGASLAKVLP